MEPKVRLFERGMKGLFILSVSFIVVGCAVPHQQNRKEFTAMNSTFGPFEEATEGDAAGHVFEKYDEFLLSHIEYDDQGKMWEGDLGNGKNQLEALEQRVSDEIKTSPGLYKNGMLMLAFAHGWRHDSREGDGNLADFRKALHDMAKAEKKGRNRRVVGVYLSWRGGRYDETGPLGKLNVVPAVLSYWDRKATAHNIGYNAMGETLTRLGRLKARVVREGEGVEQKEGNSRALLIGHSFGAAAIFSGVQRYFEDELIRVEQKNYQAFVRRRWDLVVLINPAFEALRYETIDRYNRKIPPTGTLPLTQIPRMMVVSAANDAANKSALPIGQTLGDLLRPKQKDNERFKEKSQHTTALGFYDDFRTHDLVTVNGDMKLRLSAPLKSQVESRYAEGLDAFSIDGQSYLQPFRNVFDPAEPHPRVRPFMVVQAEEAIVDNHNGIWNREFHTFLVNFIEAKEQAVDLIP